MDGTIFDSQIFWIILWASVFFIALVVELATTELVSIWFCGASLVTEILAAAKVGYLIQIIVWITVAAALLLVFKLFLEKKFKARTQKTNYDALIGEDILITEPVSKNVNGAGKYRDVVWTVASDEDIAADEYAEIVEISGNKLIVKKK